ncbi:BCCT family transporter [Neisseriaceae bacterium PsAf]|nr:BCCT family transporter [Neisseriaceae bacterium PsAf]
MESQQKNSQSKNLFSDIDYYTFFGVLLVLLGFALPLLFYPDWSAQWVDYFKTILTDQLGVFYLGFGALAVIFVLFIAFSDIGKIKLGKPEEDMEYPTYSWAAMLFCAGIGASILYWGMIEWAFYYQAPPFEIETGTSEAVEWAATYGIFHWGPVAWSIYLVPAIAMSYFYHVRNQPVLKISQCLAPVLGEKRANSYFGKTIDILFVFGMIGGGATTLGLASPLITEGLNKLFGFPVNITTQLIVLLFTTMLFAYSAFQGMKKGIQVLSNINFYLAVIFLFFVLLVGPTIFILDVGFESLGKALTNMARMMTWNEAFSGFPEFGFKKSNFPQNWTIFYWAWWLVFSPTIGIFIAKISRGRTLRQVVVGSLFFGSLGCAAFFIILGNYGLYLQISGQLDVLSLLNNVSPTAAIFGILETLPIAKVSMAVFTVLAIIFTATTFDSISYILASVVQKEVDEEPMRWNRLFWAFALCLLPTALLLAGDLSTLQAAAVISAAPLLLVAVALIVSIIKAIKYDLYFQPDYSPKTIHIDEIPDNAPWEIGETSDAPEGSILHTEGVYEQMRKDQEDEESNKENNDKEK